MLFILDCKFSNSPLVIFFKYVISWHHTKRRVGQCTHIHKQAHAYPAYTDQQKHSFQIKNLRCQFVQYGIPFLQSRLESGGHSKQSIQSELDSIQAIACDEEFLLGVRDSVASVLRLQLNWLEEIRSAFKICGVGVDDSDDGTTHLECHPTDAKARCYRLK